MQQASCDHKPVLLTTTMLANMHKCGKVMHATMQGAPEQNSPWRPEARLRLVQGRAGAGARFAQAPNAPRSEERSGRGRRRTHPQHGEGTARRRVRQRDSLQEGGEEREGGQGGEWKTNRGDARACYRTYATRMMRRTGQAVGMSHQTCHTQQTHTQRTKTLVPAGTPWTCARSEPSSTTSVQV